MTNDQQLTKEKIEKEVPTAEPKKKRGRRPSDEPSFPLHSLKKSLQVIEAIEKNYAGDPTDPVDIADAIGTTLNSSNFRNLLTSSHRYGLTNGSYKSEKIEMTPLGSSIVEFTSDNGRNEALLEALLQPDVFKNFLQKYDRKEFPREEIIRNVLKNDFNIPHERVETCATILTENVNNFSLIHEKTKMLRLSQLSEPKPQKTPQEDTSDSLDVQEQEYEEEQESQPVLEKITPKVFISHGKNQNILDQMKTILEFGSFEYIIAEEVETSAIPIPDKVFGLMRECNCAIINVSADEEMKQGDGSYRINENVLIEIGAAFVHYNKRVILLVDKRIDLPSNLQGLYKCEYEGNELSFLVAMKLQKTLTEFKKTLD